MRCPDCVQARHSRCTTADCTCRSKLPHRRRPEPEPERDDHVLPAPGMDPAKCGVRRGMYDRAGNCWVCRYRPLSGEHCYLYERCDRCLSEDDPCGPAQRVMAVLP